MNIGQIKILSWTSAGLLTLGLSYYVWDFVSHLEERNQPPDPKKVKLVLEDVEPIKAKADEVVPYADIKRLFHTTCSECKANAACRHLNWTGKEKEKPKAEDPGQPLVAPKVAAEELVSILMIKADMSDRKNSSIYFKYKPKANIPNNGPAGGFLLKEGEHLLAPHDKVRLDEVTGEGVWFAFEGEERERELVRPGAFASGTTIVQVDKDGVIWPKVGSQIPKAQSAPFRPGKTTKLGADTFQLGSDDLKYLEENYQEELTRNVRTTRHQDPRTGKYDGIEITSVTPGSAASAHGAQEGDVIKSINGQPVSSVQEAIHFVKTHSNQYTTWEVVIESKGRLKTVTYHSPSN